MKEGFPAGHFYSTIPCEKDVEYGIKSKNGEINKKELPGIKLNLENQLKFMKDISDEYKKVNIEFPINKTADYLYYFENTAYSYSDALVLSAMINHLRPKKIIEIGSGHSSCATLDTIRCIKKIDKQYNCECTFIEPYPALLNNLLKNNLLANNLSYNIIDKCLQEVDLNTFKQLEKNDILFVDSTHVSKTGSDVNYIIHQILPHLNPGVFIHFHDIFWPFEYPEGWIINNGWYWNELYMLRSFLQYNINFQIASFSTYLWHHSHSQMSKYFPLGIRNPGGAIWLQKLF